MDEEDGYMDRSIDIAMDVTDLVVERKHQWGS